jgi:dynein heavy chain
MPSESPIAYGMHSNAEIGFRLLQAETMLKSIASMQPRSASGAGGMSLQDKAKQVLDDIMEKLPDFFDMVEILEKVEERSPFVNVFLQEIERMNLLLGEIRRSLAELDLGLKGDLQISDAMDSLMISLSEDKVPARWEKLAFPSLRSLASWMVNLLGRVKQLQDWTGDMGLPKVTILSALFNPQSFLTAVMQTTARRNDWPLDKTVVQTEVTKKSVEEITATSRDGAFITGLVLEGARWDEKAGNLEDSRPKELFSPMPVVLIKAVTVDKAEVRDAYLCPVYKTQQRGPTYVFTAQLRSKVSINKWVVAGVGILMDVVAV